MKKIYQYKKDEIIKNICDSDFKKLIYNLNKFKIFSKEKGMLKKYKNRIQFLVRNKIQSKPNFFLIEDSLRAIFENIKNQ
jgi:hypothetical protein